MRRSWLLSAMLALLAREARAQDFRPWQFSVDGTVQAPRSVTLESGAAYNGVTGGSLTPEDARRAIGWIASTVGVTDRLQLSGALAYVDDPTRRFSVDQARVEALVQLLKARRGFPVALAIGGGYQADALLDHAVTGVVAASAYLGRLQLTLNVRVAHYFAAGRDPLDVFVTAGAMVKATGWLRVGAEYVGEELEADDGDGATGARHYVGPAAAVLLAGGRMRLSATAGAVITAGQTGPLARGSLAWLF
jgi:hypothetical protein